MLASLGTSHYQQAMDATAAAVAHCGKRGLCTRWRYERLVVREQSVSSDQVGSSIGLARRKPVHERLEVRWEINDCRDAGQAEQCLTDRRGRAELHLVLEPSRGTVEQLVR